MTTNEGSQMRMIYLILKSLLLVTLKLDFYFIETYYWLV